MFKNVEEDIKELTKTVKQLRELVKTQPEYQQMLNDAEKHLRRLMRTEGIRKAHELTLDRTNKVKDG